MYAKKSQSSCKSIEKIWEVIIVFSVLTLNKFLLVELHINNEMDNTTSSEYYK